MPVVLESAKVMSKGQVTIPKDIREKMKINEGDQVVFVYDNEKVVIMNAAIYAMKLMQEVMNGEAEKQGINEEDVNKIIREVR
ncbi:MAG: AbrB/MazE/SpoVT family DNA-binding domain-containing protein [Lachnospiraceae bacterium]|nr:AbrB/MazE/SpoVT family DNA-binding domain-containing protein [Lachnospiraceae bacterium]